LTAREGFVAARLLQREHKMIAMLESGLEVRKVITHRLSAEKFLEGFEIMRRGESGKIVLDWA
jgi:threonine 3-dehydrogenase